MKFLALICIVVAVLLAFASADKEAKCLEPFSKKDECRSLSPFWSFNSETNECEEHKGCPRGKNHFNFEKECIEACKN